MISLWKIIKKADFYNLYNKSLLQVYEVTPKSFVSNFWGAVQMLEGGIFILFFVLYYFVTLIL